MANKNLDNEYSEISKIKAKERKSLFSKKNVVGVGIGDKIIAGKHTGETCITVFVSKKLNSEKIKSSDLVPSTIENYKTDVVEVGNIVAIGAEEKQESEINDGPLTGRIRPVIGGYSIGHVDITAGTMATVVTDNPQNTKFYILSNNHVLANSNNAKIGDSILQPGSSDGGKSPEDSVAKLSRFVPIEFIDSTDDSTDDPVNYVDAAIAEGSLTTINSRVYRIGNVKRIGPAKVGSRVQKSGRTTNYTKGDVTHIDVDLKVNFPGRVAYFEKQILTTPMSEPGDSGSLLFDANNNAIGLLFAGSDQVTVYNHIDLVCKYLKIQLMTEE